MELILVNARIVLLDQVLENSSLLIKDGYIAAINPKVITGIKTIDLKDKILMPGMIDLHCDAIEKEIEPRPGVFFPMDFAVAQIDRKNAMAGITTPFHSISFAHEELGVRNNEIAAKIVRAIHDYQPNSLVDNRVHCRYEITDNTSLEILLSLLDEDAVHLFSLMDHTPGQGQFKDLEAYHNYMSRTYKMTRDEVETMARKKIENALGARKRIETLIAQAKTKNVHIASHDDDNIERIETMAEMGINFSEFPINLETAKAAINKGMKTIFGSPNILRGKSQSGSMKALEAIEHKVASCLCSDYAPATLLMAIFKLLKVSQLSLPEVVALVTFNPAQGLGLDDRGEIAVGKRADLIEVQLINELPQVTKTWLSGQLIHSSNYH